MSRFLQTACLFALLTVVFVDAGLAFAQKRDADAQGTVGKADHVSQVLLLMQIARDKNGQRRESRFAEELKMSLDELTIHEIPQKNSDFGDLVLGRQIATVRPLIDKHRAVAAIWLTEDSPSVLLLHLVAVTTGRALVRIVETDLDKAGEAELAASARELLGTAYLFDVSAENSESPMGRVVDSVRHTVAPPHSVEKTQAPVVPALEPGRKWSVSVTGEFKGGIYGQDGPALWLGGRAGLERVLVGGLRARGSLGVLAGPLGKDGDIDVNGVMLTPGLGLLYLWDIDPFSLGLALDVRAQWLGLTIQAGEGRAKQLSEWQLNTALKAEFRWHVTQRIGLVLSGGLEGTPHQEIVHQEIDESIVYATPFVSYELGLGMLIIF